MPHTDRPAFARTQTMTTPIIRIAFAGLGALVFATSAFPQPYPSRPIRWIVPTAAGGAYDVVARAVATQMAANLGQPIVVDNRAAAAGIVGMEAIARAAPDGYTIGTTGVSQLTMHPSIYAKLPYDTRRDFAPITMLVSLPLALWVHTSVPANSMAEFITYVKANPGKLNYGSAGIGHSFHLATELLSQRAGISMVHVPYKGTSPAIQDLLAGRIQLMFYPPTGPMISHIKDGRLRAIATASEKRLAALPDVPTFEEAGVREFDVAGWAALSAPAGTPREIVSRLNREAVKAVMSPEAVKIYEKMGFVQATSTPEELAGRIDREIAMWGALIRTLGIKAE